MASIGSRNGPDRFKSAHSGGGRYVRKAGAALFTFAALFIVFGSNQAQARCKSQAYKKVDAQAYCGPILKCGAKAPPQVMVCRGAPRRWICSCTTPPPPPPPGGGQNQGSLWLEEKDPQAMLSALLAAQNGLEQRQQIDDVAPAYGRQQVPSALAAAQGAVADRQDEMARARVLDELRRRDRDHDDDDDDGRNHRYDDDDQDDDHDSGQVTDPGDGEDHWREEAGGGKKDRKGGDHGKRSELTEYIERGGHEANATGGSERGQLRESADATGLFPPFRAGSRTGGLERGQDSRQRRLSVPQY